MAAGGVFAGIVVEGSGRGFDAATNGWFLGACVIAGAGLLVVAVATARSAIARWGRRRAVGDRCPKAVAAVRPPGTVSSGTPGPEIRGNDAGLQRQLGELLRAHRRRLGLSQEELGTSLGLDRTYIGCLERGERNITLRTVERLSGALGVDLLVLASTSGTGPTAAVARRHAVPPADLGVAGH